MRIEKDVEPRVREGFAASVAEEPDRFDLAMENLGSDDDAVAQALSLAFAVDAAALMTIHGTRSIPAERLEYLANEFARTQTWAQVTESTARTYLEALIEGRNPVELMSPGDAAYAALAIGGWLLAAFPQGDGINWNNFLDQILDGLESAP
jgi:hypothetical protein